MVTITPVGMSPMKAASLLKGVREERIHAVNTQRINIHAAKAEVADTKTTTSRTMTIQIMTIRIVAIQAMIIRVVTSRLAPTAQPRQYAARNLVRAPIATTITTILTQNPSPLASSGLCRGMTPSVNLHTTPTNTANQNVKAWLRPWWRLH